MKQLKQNKTPSARSGGLRLLNKENAFWVVCTQAADGTLTVPATYPTRAMDGKFTRIALAKAVLDGYLNETWNFAEKEQVKQVRKDYKEKVEKKEARAEVG